MTISSSKGRKKKPMAAVEWWDMRIEEWTCTASATPAIKAPLTPAVRGPELPPLMWNRLRTASNRKGAALIRVNTSSLAPGAKRLSVHSWMAVWSGAPLAEAVQIATTAGIAAPHATVSQKKMTARFMGLPRSSVSLGPLHRGPGWRSRIPWRGAAAARCERASRCARASRLPGSGRWWTASEVR